MQAVREDPLSAELVCQGENHVWTWKPQPGDRCRCGKSHFTPTFRQRTLDEKVDRLIQEFALLRVQVDKLLKEGEA